MYLFLHSQTRFLLKKQDKQLKIHLKTNRKRKNYQSSNFNTESFVKIWLLLLGLAYAPSFSDLPYLIVCHDKCD